MATPSRIFPAFIMINSKNISTSIKAFRISYINPGLLFHQMKFLDLCFVMMFCLTKSKEMVKLR